MKSDQAKSSFPASPDQPVKRAYVKPAFRREQVFETMALACGKVNPTQLICQTNRKLS